MTKKKPINTFTFILVITILMFIIGFVVFQLKGINLKEKEKTIVLSNNITLQKILTYETSNITIPDGNCLAYATYFNTTLSEKYPELDIRWIRHMDICNDLTLCDDYHTYLMIGGYNTLCMLNSKRYDCVDFPKEY